MSSPPFVDAQSHMSTPARPLQHYQPRPQQFATPVRFPPAPDTPGSSKSVRFQSQPLPPTQQQLALQPQPRPSPIAQPAPATTPTAVPQRVPTAAPTPAPMQSSVVVSSTSLVRRLHWNASALAVLWLTPLLTTRPKDLYWAGLDLVYEHFGGNVDERVDAVVGWTMWASTIVLLFNALEALILLNRTNPPTPAKPQAVLGFQSPGAAKSMNFVAASRLKGSPKTRASSVGPGSPIAASHSPRSPGGTPAAKDAVDYAQFSPSLRRSSPSANTRSVSASGVNARSSSSSPMPTSVSMSSLGVSTSPLSAFRARHTPSSSPFRRSSSQLADVSLSYDDDDSTDASNFLGDESFEVERALHNLRASMPAIHA